MTTLTLADLQNLCPICEAGTLTECASVNRVEHAGSEGFLDCRFSVCSYCGSEQCDNEQTEWNKQQMQGFIRRVQAYLPTIHWHCNGQTITCTRNGLSASVEAPIQGSYTDARRWLPLLREALTVCESRLVVMEFRDRV